MRIVVASGKGGVGKTTVAVNLACSAGTCTLLDCDVEEPNAHHYIKTPLRAAGTASLMNPSIDLTTCTHCGTCSTFCRYNALAILPSTALVFPHNCNGCGGCVLVCPEHAIHEERREIGSIFSGTFGDVHFFQGLLNVGEARSPPLIREVKNRAGTGGTCIIDAPPGSSCPVVEAMEGADYVVIVTESSSYALHDMVALISVVRKMGMPFGVVLNKHVPERNEVERYLCDEGIPILGSIPLDRRIAEWCSNGELIVTKGTQWHDLFAGILSAIPAGDAL